MAEDLSPRVVAAAHRLRLDAAAREALDALAAGGIDALVLKGPSLTGWLYADDERGYLDVDLLVAPGGERRATEILQGLGHRPVLDDAAMPEWWREHSLDFERPDGVRIDLHRTLVGVAVPSERAWEILWADREAIPLAGGSAFALSVPARVAHLCLHAAQHGRANGKAVGHVDAAVGAVTDAGVWSAAADVAERLGALEPFAAGLRLAAGGEELARRLGLPAVRSPEVALRAGTVPPVALGFEQVAQAGGLRERAAILVRKAFPPRVFIEHWDPRARQGGTALARAYLRRPLWLLRRAPEGYRAWREARRSVRD